MATIVLLSCVKKKREVPCHACELYTSTLFTSGLAYARKLSPDAIYILSAKYGLVALDQELEPYDVTLKYMSTKQRKAWAVRVLEQLAQVADMQQDHFTILAGDTYRRYLLPHLTSYDIPMEGLSFGQQLQFLKAHARD